MSYVPWSLVKWLDDGIRDIGAPTQLRTVFVQPDQEGRFLDSDGQPYRVQIRVDASSARAVDPAQQRWRWDSDLGGEIPQSPASGALLGVALGNDWTPDGVKYFTEGVLANPYTIDPQNLKSGQYFYRANVEGEVNGDAWTTSQTVIVNVMPPKPVITSIEPGSAPAGALVTISGDNLSPVLEGPEDPWPGADGTFVSFNGVPVTEVVRRIDTELVVRIPAGAGVDGSGPVEPTVAFTRPGGNAFVDVVTAGGRTRQGGFTITPGSVLSPVILGIYPSTVIPGQQLTIQGSNLQSAQGVRIGGATAPIVSSQLEAVVVVVPQQARNGRISVTTLAGRVDSPFSVSIRRHRYGPPPSRR